MGLTRVSTVTTDETSGPTGDLARLSEWWHDRNPGTSRELAWIVDPQDPDEVSAAVDRAIDSGATLIVLHMNSDDARSRAAIALIADVPPTAVIDQERAASDHQWMVTVAEVRDELEPLRGLPIAEAIEALDAPGAKAAAVALKTAAARRTPTLFDGVAGYAGALMASRDDIDARWWWLPATSTSDPAIATAQEVLDAHVGAHLGTRGTSSAALQAVLSLLDVVDP